MEKNLDLVKMELKNITSIWNIGITIVNLYEYIFHIIFILWCVNSAIITSIFNSNNNCVRCIVLQCEIVF